MIVVTPPPLQSIADALVAYMNHLRVQHAWDQNMIQRGPDDKVLARLDEVRTKNTELEQANRVLRQALDSQRTYIEGRTLGELALRAELKAVKEQNAELLNQLDALRNLPEIKPPKVHIISEEQAKLAEAHATTVMPRKAIDGDATIRDGRKNLNQFIAETRQPNRGE